MIQSILYLFIILGTHFDFRYLAPLLVDAGFRVIRIDFPGFGETIKPADFAANFYNMTQFLANFLDSIGLQKIDMAIGHSFGCAIVAMFSVRQPGVISSFTFLSSIGFKPHKSIRPYTGKTRDECFYYCHDRMSHAKALA